MLDNFEYHITDLLFLVLLDFFCLFLLCYNLTVICDSLKGRDLQGCSIGREPDREYLSGLVLGDSRSKGVVLLSFGVWLRLDLFLLLRLCRQSPPHVAS